MTQDIPTWACDSYGDYEHDWLYCPDCVEGYERYLELEHRAEPGYSGDFGCYPEINYKHIADAVKFYSKIGYKYIEVPWIVGDAAIDATKPPLARYFKTYVGNLVASGEQSLLQVKHTLRPVAYQCVTPCFRDEPFNDSLHQTYFLKNELMWVLGERERPEWFINAALKDATRFFSEYVPVKLMETSIGIDIVSQKAEIELGSYGYREWEGFRWVYGTGCAEPRLSQVIQEERSL